jgi:hypothetical protein
MVRMRTVAFVATVALIAGLVAVVIGMSGLFAGESPARVAAKKNSRAGSPFTVPWGVSCRYDVPI